MSNMSNDDSGSMSKSMIPRWDGKKNTYALYKEQFGAVAVFLDCADVLDETTMARMPTKSVYEATNGRDTTANPWSPDEKKLISLWEQNKKMSSIFTLGQNSNHGIMVLVETKSDEYPHGKIWTAFRTLDKKYKPKDFTAEIECENEIESIVFALADEYYTQVVEVCAKYEYSMSDSAKLKYLAKKCQSPTYIALINRELESSTPSFEKACDDIAKIQRLAKSGTKTAQEQKRPGKEVTLNSTEQGGGDKKNCPFCNGKHARKDCTKRKEALKKQGDCPECGKGNHLEKECWKKNPSKAPKWWNREGNKSKETSNANVELMVPSLECAGVVTINDAPISYRSKKQDFA